eukprot:Platyproteum_vivax@DN10759_c0_g1_i1.p1
MDMKVNFFVFLFGNVVFVNALRFLPDEDPFLHAAYGGGVREEIVFANKEACDANLMLDHFPEDYSVATMWNKVCAIERQLKIVERFNSRHFTPDKRKHVPPLLARLKDTIVKMKDAIIETIKDKPDMLLG